VTEKHLISLLYPASKSSFDVFILYILALISSNSWLIILFAGKQKISCAERDF